MNDQDDQPGADESDVQVIFFLLDEAVSGLSWKHKKLLLTTQDLIIYDFK